MPRRLVPLLAVLGFVLFAHGCTVALAWRADVAPGTYLSANGHELRRDPISSESAWRRKEARERHDETLTQRELTDAERRDMGERIAGAGAYNLMLYAIEVEVLVTVFAGCGIALWTVLAVGCLGYHLIRRRRPDCRRDLVALGIGIAATGLTMGLIAWLGVGGDVF